MVGAGLGTAKGRLRDGNAFDVRFISETLVQERNALFILDLHC
ncbi:hypothetical protein RR42_m2768 [Cupriavidus basilensis]|uniref:Uncharacterized protein n=1 Tax=Cupriavidus basilensis TaxID=68895 RepID=A0A0C4Y4B9_9BURK|nr:hypothetical protein RR42_m2768 [Cupriavidus basilensis]